MSDNKQKFAEIYNCAILIQSIVESNRTVQEQIDALKLLAESNRKAGYIHSYESYILAARQIKEIEEFWSK